MRLRSMIGFQMRDSFNFGHVGLYGVFTKFGAARSNQETLAGPPDRKIKRRKFYSSWSRDKPNTWCKRP